MEPREIHALYAGYEWRRRREAGTLTFLLMSHLNRMKREGGVDLMELNRLVESAETWEPEDPDR